MSKKTPNPLKGAYLPANRWMAKPPLGGWGSLRGFSGVSCMLRPHIAQTIKSFEKALQPKALLSFGFPKTFVRSALSAPSFFPLGPNNLAKRPQSEAQRGPFARSFGPDDRPFWELGDRWRLRNQKRGALAYSSCQCKDNHKKDQKQMADENS